MVAPPAEGRCCPESGCGQVQIGSCTRDDGVVQATDNRELPYSVGGKLIVFSISFHFLDNPLRQVWYLRLGACAAGIADRKGLLRCGVNM